MSVDPGSLWKFSNMDPGTKVRDPLVYCVFGLPKYQVSRLQSVLRSAARLVLRLPGSSSISSLMREQLHWLPFPDRIDYKLCVLAYKCLHDSAPVYISETCKLVSSFPGRSQLRSASAGNLIVPVIRTKTIGTEVFSTRVRQCGTHYPQT